MPGAVLVDLKEWKLDTSSLWYFFNSMPYGIWHMFHVLCVPFDMQLSFRIAHLLQLFLYLHLLELSSGNVRGVLTCMLSIWRLGFHFQAMFGFKSETWYFFTFVAYGWINEKLPGFPNEAPNKNASVTHVTREAQRWFLKLDHIFISIASWISEDCHTF